MRRVIVWTVLVATLSLLAFQVIRTAAPDLGSLGLAISMVPMAIVGALLSLRVPGNTVGPLLAGAGLGGAIAGLTDTVRANGYLAAGLPASPSGIDQATVDAYLLFDPDLAWIAAHIVGNVGGLSAAFATLGLLPILFPTGSSPRSWRWATRALGSLLALVIAIQVFGSPLTDVCFEPGPDIVIPPDALIDPADECIVQAANPFAVQGIPGSNSALGSAIVGISFMVAMTIGAGAFTMRYRAADRGVRQQMRWLMATLGVFVAGYVPTTLLIEVGGLPIPAWVVDLYFLVGLTLIPVSIGIAVLRYRLYDLGRILSRTLTYALLAGLVAVGYAAGAVWIPTALGFSDDPVWIAATTLALALAFNPVRRRLTRWLDRRFNRTPYDPDTVLDKLTTELRTATSADSITAAWGAEVADSLQPADLSIWTRP